MSTRLTQADRVFLRACGIDAGHEQKPALLDGTQKLMFKCGVDPHDRAEYIRLASAGTIDPNEPLDGEIEAMLPDGIRSTDGEDLTGDEPSYTTPAGIPLCARCGRSTRNMERLVCAPCREGTRLLLTRADVRWLKGVKIKR